MARLPAPSLQTKSLLVLLLGAVTPLGIFGFWLTRSAARSGEVLLEAELERTLGQLIQEIGNIWVGYRSQLLDFAESPAVSRELGEAPAWTPDLTPPPDLQAAYQPLQAIARRVTIRDVWGDPRWRLTPPSNPDQPLEPGPPAYLPVMLKIYDQTSGSETGRLEAELRLSILIPSGAAWAGVGGSVLGILDPATGAPFVPIGIESAELRKPRFGWGNEPWLGVRRVLTEPPVELVLAAPLRPSIEPFEQAARHGVLALAVVATAAIVLTILLTGRITRSLRLLATAAEAVAHGDLDHEVVEPGRDEVGRVAHAFNQMTENLRRTLNELARRQSLAAVGEFAASLAHEVRNPLSAIRVDLQRVEETAADSHTRELVTRALRSIARLDATVTGALRVARSGQVVRERLDLRAPLEAAVRSVEFECGKRDIELQRPPLAAEVPVLGDAAALDQLFLNLLLNAVQAVESGGRVAVALEVEHRQATVTVRDGGCGMAPQVVERVREPFFSTKPEGTGLGLTIAQRIAEAHGGEIEIESSPGTGTEVRVTLPLAAAAASQPGVSDRHA